MSAFALRKRLLKEQSSSAPELSTLTSSESENPVVSSPAEAKPSRPKRQKRARDAGASSSSTASAVDTRSRIDLPTPALEGVKFEGQASPSSSSAPDLDEEVAEKDISTSQVQLSSFKSTKNKVRARKDGGVLLHLDEGERLVILGNYGIRVSDGEITLGGAILRPSKKIHWVDSPHCHALPVIRCSEQAKVEFLQDPRAEQIRHLGRLSPLFRRLWNERASISPEIASSSTMPSSFQILQNSSDGPKRALLQDLVSPPEWNRELSRIVGMTYSRPPVLMITGPKSSGKSTIGKILANRLLTNSKRSTRKVAVLDLDPGQPEYCLPGQIALALLTEPILGPSFCQAASETGRSIIRSHTMASVTPSSDPELYVEIAMDLAAHYRNSLGAYPLVINTPGWIQGTGLDLLSSLVTSLRPSEVLYMSQTGPSEVVESLQVACGSIPFTTLPSQTTQYTTRTAGQLRAMQTMAYFHTNADESPISDRRPRWNPSPLTNVAPWQVSFQGLNQGFHAIVCYDYQAPLDLLADTINGSVLAVVHLESVSAIRNMTDGSIQSESGYDNDEPAADEAMDIDLPNAPGSAMFSQKVVRTPEGIPFLNSSAGTTLDPRYSRCIGLVLVRGVDVANGTLQLLTPISAKSLEEAEAQKGKIVLVSGKFDSPNWAYTEDLYFRDQGGNGDLGEHSGGAGVSESDAEEAHTRLERHSNRRDVGDALTPWVEVLHGNQKRNAGSKVWRVRRDLGRTGATD